MSKQGSADMGRMLLYIILPMAIVKSYMRDFSTEMLRALIISFVLALLALLLAIVVSRLLFRKEESVERFGAAFSNAGFIGIPLVQMALGSEAVFYVASFVAILNILQWTYGVYIMTGDRSVIRLKKIATNPIVISFLAGLFLFLAPFSLPQMLQDTIGTLSNMNGPIAMIVLGTYLAQIPLKELFTEKLVYKCTVIRLILIPALTSQSYIGLSMSASYVSILLSPVLFGLLAQQVSTGLFSLYLLVLFLIAFAFTERLRQETD